MSDNKRLTMPVPAVFTGPRKHGSVRTMERADFSGVYTEVFTVCQEALEKQGHFAATVFVLQVNDKGKIGVAFPAPVAELFQQHGQRGKAVAARYMQFMVEHAAVDFVALVAEAWQSPQETNAELSAPSLHPDRTEVLMFNLMSEDCQALAACPFVRNPVTGRATVLQQLPLEYDRPGQRDFEGKFIRPRTAAPN